MADATGNKPAAKAKDDGMKELRILMLHGKIHVKAIV